MVLANDDYDADQGQSAEEKLPITENLIFMRYSVNDDGSNMVELASEDGGPNTSESAEPAKIGYVFYYPELNTCKIIECEPDR